MEGACARISNFCVRAQVGSIGKESDAFVTTPCLSTAVSQPVYLACAINTAMDESVSFESAQQTQGTVTPAMSATLMEGGRLTAGCSRSCQSIMGGKQVNKGTNIKSGKLDIK